MALEIIDCAQNSPEWHTARCGVITASSFQKILTGGDGKTRNKYMRQIAAERIRGISGDSFSNNHTERGHEFEEVAVEEYVRETGLEVIKCGFMKDKYGYSPDGLVGDDGAIEIKTRLADLQIELLMSGKFPNEHVAQVQGGLMVSGRQWVDFRCYCADLPTFKDRIYRDERYITNLKMELALFEKGVEKIIEQITALF